MPRRHLIIPDTQLKPGVPTDHIGWAAQAILDYLPDVIVVLGDWWDMASLSRHDACFPREKEGQSYEADIAIGNECFAQIVAPIEKERQRRITQCKKRWNPRCVFLFGNHEGRIHRALCDEPKYAGMIGEHQCLTPGFERVPFLEVVQIDGILYSHYFANINSGKPIGGSIDNRLNKIGESFVQGHEQGLLLGMRQFPSGKTRHGLVCGSFYQHDEPYKGRQGNGHWRGIVVLNEVQDGGYDVMPLSMDYLRRKYG